MSDSRRQPIEQALDQIATPYIGQSLLASGCVHSLAFAGDTLKVQLQLGFPAAGIAAALVQEVQQNLTGLAGLERVDVEVNWEVPDNCARHALPAIGDVRNIIAIASGKGGVGKSTCAVNLALALAAEGARVGLLDGDIYGPSQQLMLGVGDEQRPQQHGDQHLLPIEAHGLQTMSMGYLTTSKTPMVWRGPMASSALQQMVGQTLWQDLDYLIIDMPPGTGDIQLTLSQRVPVSGAVIITTPQDIALLDAIKGVEMFRKVDVPVLGVIENMSWHTCSNCGHREFVFGEGGGDRLARDYGVEMLGSLPLSLSIRQQADSGNPTVAAEPDSETSAIYRDMARRIGASLWLRSTHAEAGVPTIQTVDD
jgi:ATP-binding protein involved in chromosome partitioning